MPRRRGRGAASSFYNPSVTDGGGGGTSDPSFPTQPVLSEGPSNGPGTGAMPSIVINNTNQAYASAINETGPGNATNTGGNTSTGGGKKGGGGGGNKGHGGGGGGGGNGGHGNGGGGNGGGHGGGGRNGGGKKVRY